jgi:Thylakoid formation protein
MKSSDSSLKIEVRTVFVFALVVLKQVFANSHFFVQLNYKPGAADTEFAKRFKNLVGAKVKTVGEAFAEFTKELGYSVNPLYKSMVTDLVGTTHLVVVCARFRRDPVWSLGMVTALDLLLKNYPEPEVGEKIVSALFTSVGLQEAEIKKEAQQMLDWASKATREEVEAALMGEGSSVLASTAQYIKKDEFWMYSRYFGVGLLKIMESVGIEMDKDEVYPIMEDWMSKKLGRSHLTACVSTNLVCFYGNSLVISPVVCSTGR